MDLSTPYFRLNPQRPRAFFWTGVEELIGRIHGNDAVLRCLVLLILLPTKIAAAPPSIEQKFMEETEFMRLIKRRETVEGQKIESAWLVKAMEEVTDNDGVMDSRELQLEDCRVVGNCYLWFRDGQVNVLWKRVAMDGAIHVEVQEDAEVNLSIEDSVIEGGMRVQSETEHAGGNLNLVLKNLTIRNDYFTGWDADEFTAEFDNLRVEGDCEIANLGPRSHSLLWQNGWIGGDLRVFGLGTYQNENHRPSGSLPEINWSSSSLQIGGRATFRRCHFTNLDFDKFDSDDERWTEISGRLEFETVTAEAARLTRLILRQDVRFQDCDFGELWLDRTIFEKDVSFAGTTVGLPRRALPTDHLSHTALPRGGWSADGTRFGGQLNFAWWEMGETRSWYNFISPATADTFLTGWSRRAEEPYQPAPVSKETWEALHEAARRGPSLDVAAETYYRARLLDGSAPPVGTKETCGEAAARYWHRIRRHIGLWTWGYGYRPLRPVLWLGALFGFGALCFAPRFMPTNSDFTDEPIPLRNPTFYDRLGQLRSSLWFAMEVGLPISFRSAFSQPRPWKVPAVLLWALAKIFLLLLAKALANTSPLLKEITDKLLPFG
jgi:hypothetical protein